MTVVSGTYLRAGDGTAPASGYIRFILQPAARDSSGAQRWPTPVYAQLDDAGSFTIDLVPDADLVDVDGTAIYEVVEWLDGIKRGPWTLALIDATPVDLPERYPGDTYVAGSAAAALIPGPAGAPGGAALSGWWEYSSKAGTVPGSGELRSAGDASVGGTLYAYLHQVDDDGLDWSLVAAEAGDSLTLRSAEGETLVGEVTAATDHGDYAELALLVGSSTATTPPKGQRVQVSLVRAASGGGGLPDKDPDTGQLYAGGVELGDTGARYVGDFLDNGWQAWFGCTLQRQGDTVIFTGIAKRGTDPTLYTLPSGFRPQFDEAGGGAYCVDTGEVVPWLINGNTQLQIVGGTAQGTIHRISAAWTTGDAWPSAPLPGWD